MLLVFTLRPFCAGLLGPMSIVSCPYLILYQPKKKIVSYLFDKNKLIELFNLIIFNILDYNTYLNEKLFLISQSILKCMCRESFGEVALQRVGMMRECRHDHFFHCQSVPFGTPKRKRRTQQAKESSERLQRYSSLYVALPRP